jgi:hypothetical protein
VLFTSVTYLDKFASSQNSQNRRGASTQSFRQAPLRPLSHYIDREAALVATEFTRSTIKIDHSALIAETAVGVADSFREHVSTFIDHDASFGPAPLTELRSTNSFSSNRSMPLQVVSVRRGWNSRLVSRLSARPFNENRFYGEAILTTFSEINEVVPTKAAPLLMAGSEGSERDVTNWVSGAPQALRSSALTRLLSRLAGVPVHLVRVNALALARFDFDRDIASRTPITEISRSRSTSNRLRAPTSARFLSRLEQEMGSRFSAASGRLPDLLRLGFVAIYLKNANVLAQLLATSLARLPRNRKEIPFIRFRIKVVKVLVSARPERLGVRISFKGRVARWNRTKVLIGESGRLALYTYSSRLEGGRAQAITRKGTRGVRVWLAYHPSFAKRFRPTLLAFRRSTVNLCFWGCVSQW